MLTSAHTTGSSVTLTYLFRGKIHLKFSLCLLVLDCFYHLLVYVFLYLVHLAMIQETNNNWTSITDKA